ncbi:MAG: peptidoglycan-binding protein [Clostridia bacterium]|nr:peptidoglycan-binding protein [Clostridia bacterium]
MKKLLCAALAALLLCSMFALAEGTLAFTSGDTEAKLEEMIPVLDSLALCMNVSSADTAFQVAYDPEDSHLIWNQLWRLSADWLSLYPQYQVPGGLKIPATVMDACAKASFGTRWNPLPAIPNSSEGGTVVYDPAEDAYRVSLGETDGHYMSIESYALDGEAMVVNGGLYDATGQRLGGLTARMEAAESGAMYPYNVTDAHAESSADFDGLWATLCDIRYTAPLTAAATALPTATPVPTATPTAVPVETGYRTLSSGSRGEDVRELQRRLNALGYNCGSADGVFGSGTKRAVSYFQEALGYSRQDGVATAELQRKLFASSAPKYDKYVTLKRGSSGVRVENLQSRLRELGYTAAPVDGSYGSRVAEAVRLFQADAGLSADGVAGRATLKALDSHDAPYCSDFIDLEKGDSGSRVTEMQDRLEELGYYDHTPSGRYDSNTVDAVADFKSDYGLKGNGKSASAEVIEYMFEDLDPVEDEDEELEEDEDIDEDVDEDDYADDDDEYVDDDDYDYDDEDDDYGEDEDDYDDEDDDYDDYAEDDDDYVDFEDYDED